LTKDADEKHLRAFFKFLGLNIPDSGEPLPLCVLYETVANLRALPQPLEEFEVASQILETYLQNNCLAPEHLKPGDTLMVWLMEHRNKLLLPERGAPPAIKVMATRLQGLAFRGLVTSSRADEARAFLQLLIREGQPLAGIYRGINLAKILGSFKGFEGEADFAIDTLSRLCKENLAVGFMPSDDELLLENPLDPVKLVVGEKVLCQDKWGTWFIGRIVEKNSNGNLRIDYGSRHLLTVEEGATLYPARLTN